MTKKVKKEDRRVLSNQFNILVELYEASRIEGKALCFTDLVERVKDYCTKAETWFILEKAQLGGLVEGKWERIDGVYAYRFVVDKDFEPFIVGLYHCLDDELSLPKPQRKKRVEKETDDGLSK